MTKRSRNNKNPRSDVTIASRKVGEHLKHLRQRSHRSLDRYHLSSVIRIVSDKLMICATAGSVIRRSDRRNYYITILRRFVITRTRSRSGDSGAIVRPQNDSSGKRAVAREVRSVADG